MCLSSIFGSDGYSSSYNIRIFLVHHSMIISEEESDNLYDYWIMRLSYILIAELKVIFSSKSDKINNKKQCS